MLFIEMLKQIINTSIEVEGDDLMLQYAMDNIKVVHEYSTMVEFFDDAINNVNGDRSEIGRIDNARHDKHESCIAFVIMINREAESLGLPVLFKETSNREAVTKFCQIFAKEMDDEIGRMLRKEDIRNYFKK